ncbi:MAG TPA: TIGR01841 family phasin [Bauldia sp.]|jgi:phasin
MQPTRFEIPDQMRQAAETTVGQARKAVEQFLDATQKAVANAEGSARTMGAGAADLSRQSLAFVEQNIAASFELAQRLVQARTVEEMAALQQEFMRRQMTAASEQGKALGEMASRAAKEATRATSKK